MLSRTAFILSYIVYTIKEFGMELKLHIECARTVENATNFWESVDYVNHSRQLLCFITVLVCLYLQN